MKSVDIDFLVLGLVVGNLVLVVLQVLKQNLVLPPLVLDVSLQTSYLVRELFVLAHHSVIKMLEGVSVILHAHQALAILLDFLVTVNYRLPFVCLSYVSLLGHLDEGL